MRDVKVSCDGAEEEVAAAQSERLQQLGGVGAGGAPVAALTMVQAVSKMKAELELEPELNALQAVSAGAEMLGVEFEPGEGGSAPTLKDKVGKLCREAVLPNGASAAFASSWLTGSCDRAGNRDRVGQRQPAGNGPSARERSAGARSGRGGGRRRRQCGGAGAAAADAGRAVRGLLRRGHQAAVQRRRDGTHAPRHHRKISGRSPNDEGEGALVRAFTPLQR